MRYCSFGVELWIAIKLAGEQRHLRARFLPRPAWLESATQPQLRAVTIHQRKPDLRNPFEFGETKADKISRHHTDDHVGCVPQPQRLAQDLRIPAETSLPEAIAQDHDQLLSRSVVFFRREGAAQRRGGAEDGEEVVGNVLCCDRL